LHVVDKKLSTYERTLRKNTWLSAAFATSADKFAKELAALSGYQAEGWSNGAFLAGLGL